MPKPAVFLSHASADSQTLERLKVLLDARTGGSVDFFLSSDGKSIPFGRNWVHRIEQALKEAKLLFCFLTPSSVRSTWMFFEAGYTYSMGIRVIPVGCLGVTLDSIPPPLGLLQGFNIKSEDGLQNLVAVINDELAHTHPTGFSAAEYRGVFGSTSRANNGLDGVAGDLVSVVKATLSVRMLDAEACALQALKAANLPVQRGQDLISTFGLTMQGRRDSIQLELDPSLTKLTFPIVDKIAALPHASDDAANWKLDVEFHEGIEVVAASHALSAKLYGSAIELSGSDRFQLDGLEFKLGQHRSIRHHGTQLRVEPGACFIEVWPRGRSLAELRLDKIVATLFECGVISFVSNVDAAG